MPKTPNQIQGIVKAADLNIGIPDLEVLIYDIDPAQFAQEFTTGSGPTNDDPIETLYAAVPQALTWIEFPGDRLGSVLTDSKGRFKLQYFDEEFRVRNESEKRPDLCLFVLAPDHTRPGSQLGQSVRERIVHFSWVPRAQSGRIESYVVAIPPESLKNFRIPFRGETDSGLERSKQVQRSLEESKTKNSELNSLIQGEVALQLPKIENLRTVAPQRFNWLSHFNKLQLPNSGVLFKNPLTPDANVEGEAVVQGLTRFNSLTPKSIINLNSRELLKLGLDEDRLAEGESLEISYCDVLSLKGFGQSFVKVRNLLEEQKRKKYADELMTPRPSEETSDTDPPEQDPIDDPEGYIQQRVLGQISEFEPVSNKTTHSTADELAKIKETINKLELSGGPANVTAYADTHSLQIAFKDVWTAAFDKDLEASVLSLYKETVKLHEEYGLSVPDMTGISDVNEFRQFLNQINEELPYAEVLPIHPDVKKCFPQITLKIWNQLSEVGRGVLETTSYQHLYPYSSGGDDITTPPPEWATQEFLDENYEHVLKYHLTTPLARTEQLILEISSRLSEPYSFQYYAPFTINYALLLSHRQEWTPLNYQVGRLTSTTPLAPKQEISFTVKEKVNKSINQKSIEKSMLQRSSESQSISRAEVEVMKKVNTSTNFRMTAQGSISLGVGSMSSSSEFGYNSTQEAAAKQNAFNESTRKAAEEVRQERELVVEKVDSYEANTESVHKISNPNNELTVTYLLYELERRFSLRTHLHSMTPVIMVAMDIPAPHEITEAWLMEHAWIIRRCLLDDSFYQAIDFIESDFSSDQMDVEIKKANWTTQKRLVTQLEANLEDLMRIREARRTELIDMTLERDLTEAGENTEKDVAKAIFSGGLSELFKSDEPDQVEILDARRKAIESTLKHTDEKLEDIQARLSRTQEKLQEATNKYTQAIKTRERKINAIRGLKLHVRQNIFHYMHNIWDYKHPDEILMTLQHREVPFIDSATRTCSLREARPDEIASEVPGLVRDGVYYVLECGAPTIPDPANIPKKSLIEVAELEKPLGYKGNYILFPLKKCSHLTDFMSQEYLDDYFGVKDPQLESGYSTNELLAYASEILNDPEAALSSEEQDALRALVFKQLSSDTSQKEVVLPTGQLYMEALKGEQSLLEDFKLAHRGMDVLKVQEEVREKRIENLRLAQRLSQESPILDAPLSDKTVIIRGNINNLDLPIADA